MGYIYRIVNRINCKVYIGESKSLDIQQRWNGHIRSIISKYGAPALIEAFEKYGLDNFKFEVIIVCFDEDLLYYEAEYIRKYNTLVPNGYNIAEIKFITGFNSKNFNDFLKNKKIQSQKYKEKFKSFSPSISAKKYTCDRCGYITKYRYLLVNHFNRKIQCNPLIDDISTLNLLNKLDNTDKEFKKYRCKVCGKYYGNRHSKYFHQKNCKETKLIEVTHTIEDTSTIGQLANKVSILEAKVAELKESKQIQNNTILNSVAINKNITVNVNNFGQENLEYLMKRLEYYWHNKARGLIEMAKFIYFDPIHPENHTFTITNQRNGIAKVRENDKWIPKTCEEAIDDIIYTISKVIEKFMEQKKDYLKEKFPKIVDLTNNWWDKIRIDNFDEKEYKKIVKQFIKMVVIHRHVIKSK